MLPILNQSLWRDEAFNLIFAAKSPIDIVLLSLRDTTPPLNYLVLHYWMILFGNSEVSARGLSFLFHLLTVIVVFLLVRKLIKNLLVSTLISSATLINPFLLQYAFEARAYSMLAFLVCLTVYFIVSKKYIIASIILSLAVFTHNFAIFSFTSILIWFLYTKRKALKDAKNEFISIFFLPTLCIISWASIIYTQWAKVAGGFWIKQATSSIFVHTFEQFARGDLTYPTQPMLYTFTIALSFFAFSYWILGRSDEERKGISLIFMTAIIPLIITYVISALFSPIYHERYLIASAPLLVVLVGYSLYKLYLHNVKLRNILIVFVSIYLMLLVQSSEQIISTSTKPPINYAVNQILQRAQSGDIIVSQDILNFLETKYYVNKDGSNIPVYAHNADGKIPFYIGSILFDSQDVIKEMPKYRRVWLVKPDGSFDLLSQ